MLLTQAEFEGRVLLQDDGRYQWPAAAVIPAPIAYIKVAAVKKLVVGFLMRPAWPAVVTRVSAGCCPSVFL